MKTINLLTLTAIAASISSCGVNSTDTSKDNVQTIGTIDPSLMDTSIRP